MKPSHQVGCVMYARSFVWKLRPALNIDQGQDLTSRLAVALDNASKKKKKKPIYLRCVFESERLLHRLAAQQQIFFILPADGSRVNRLRLWGGCEVFASFRLCAGISPRRYPPVSGGTGTKDSLCGFNHPPQTPPVAEGPCQFLLPGCFCCSSVGLCG